MLLEIYHVVDVNIITLVVLCIFLASVRSRNEKGMPQYQLFRLLIVLNMLLACVDIFAWVFDASAGAAGDAARWMNLLSNTALYCLVPFPAAVWFLYAHYQIFHDTSRLVSMTRILLTVLVINILLSVASVWTGWYFSISAANIYQRGPWFWLHAFFSYGITGAACLMVVIYRKLLEKRSFYALLLFILPMIIGSGLQVMVFGLSLNWVAMMISILIVYLHIQDSGLNTDFLTGTYNRRHFEQIISNRIRRVGKEQSFAAVFADMDNFKKINDQFGHKAGDEALQTAAQLIKRSLRKNDLIARFGGDEFYFMMELSSEAALSGAIQRIYQEFERYNVSGSVPYSLELSMGGAIYDPKSGKTAEQFLGQVDKLMYQEKVRRRQNLCGDSLEALNLPNKSDCLFRLLHPVAQNADSLNADLD